MGRPANTILPLKPDQIARFWSKVNKTEDCWLWTAGGTKYGIVNINNRNETAHRVSFWITFGEQPPEVCHTCDTFKCVRPEHLFAGSTLLNAQDRQRKGRGAPQHSEHNGVAKITFEIAETIRDEYVPYKVTMQSLADRHGISITQVHAIIHRTAYVKPPREEVMPL